VKWSIDEKPEFSVGEIALVSEEFWGLFRNPDFLEEEVAEIPKDSYVIIVGKPKQYRRGTQSFWYPVTTSMGFGWCISEALTKVAS